MVQIQSIKIVIWQQDDAWLGYLQEYPDYWTQGKNEKILKEHLVDLYEEISSGEIVSSVYPAKNPTKQKHL